MRVNLFKAALVTVLALLLVGCGLGGGPNPDSIDQEAEGPLELSDEGQFFLDESSYELRQNGEYSYTIIVTLPTGNTSETTFTLDPRHEGLDGAAASAVHGSPLRGFDLTHGVTTEGLAWTYEYIVPTDTFPEDAFVAAADGDLPGWLVTVVDTLLDTQTASASGGEGVKVYAEGMLKEFTFESLSQAEQRIRQLGRGSDRPATSPLSQAADSIVNIVDAVTLSREYRNLMDRIAKVRECADDPTNPLTIRQYQEEPGTRERIVREIDRVETGVKTDTAVRYIGQLNSQAVALGPKWLSFVIGPLTAWADAGISRISREYVEELERLVTKCEEEDEEVEDQDRDDRDPGRTPVAMPTATPPGPATGRWSGTITSVRTLQHSEFKDQPRTVERYDWHSELRREWTVQDVHMNLMGMDRVSGQYALRYEDTRESYIEGKPLGCAGGYVTEARTTVTASDEGTSQVWFSFTGDGSYALQIPSEVFAEPNGTMTKWYKDTSFGGCYGQDNVHENEETEPITIRGMVLEVPGTLDSNDPDRLSGTHTWDVGDGMTVIVVTWDLQRH